MKHKKALIASRSSVFVIGTLVFVLMIMISPKLLGAAKSIGDTGICTDEAVIKDFKNSLSDKATVADVELISSPNIYLKSCNIDVITVTKDKYKTKKSRDALFADEAYKCYKQYANLNVFSSAEIDRGWAQQKKGEGGIWGRGEIDVETHPITCAICTKIVFEKEFTKDFEGKDNLEMFASYLRNTTKLGAGKNMYDTLDRGRYKTYTSVDLLHRYTYDPTTENVVIFYKRKGGDASLSFYTKWYNEDAGDAAVIGDLPSAETLNLRKSWLADGKKDIAAAFAANDRHAYTKGLSTYFASAGLLQIHRLFSPYLEENSPTEYGVASIPYDMVAHQCDFLANGYGALS